MNSILPRAARLGAILLGLAFPTACVDGPFAHANPFDPDNPMSLVIEGGADTVSVAGDYLQFRLVTAPALHGVLPQWGSSAPWLLSPIVKGVYYVRGLPLVEPVDVTITASIGANVATRTITLLPPAP